MSNRGRQNVASFLTKDLGLDWRMGAEWFEYLLVSSDGLVLSLEHTLLLWPYAFKIFPQRLTMTSAATMATGCTAQGLEMIPERTESSTWSNRAWTTTITYVYVVVCSEASAFEENRAMEMLYCLYCCTACTIWLPTLCCRVTMYGSGFLSWRGSGELMCTRRGLSAPLHCPMPTCPLMRPTPPPSSLRLNGADMWTRNWWVFEKEEVDSTMGTCCGHIFFSNLSNSSASLYLLIVAFIYSSTSNLFSTVFITGEKSRLLLRLSFDLKQLMISL